MNQPFERIEGISSTRFRAIFVSDSSNKFLEDRDRYEVILEMDPWDRIVSHRCECKSFKFNSGKLCRHMNNDEPDNPGLLQILKKWNEIQAINV